MEIQLIRLKMFTLNLASEATHIHTTCQLDLLRKLSFDSRTTRPNQFQDEYNRQQKQLK